MLLESETTRLLTISVLRRLLYPKAWFTGLIWCLQWPFIEDRQIKSEPCARENFMMKSVCVMRIFTEDERTPGGLLSGD